MNRRIVYIVIFVFVVAGSYGAWQVWLYLNPLVLKEDFEGGFGEWIADADVPLDPDNLNRTVEWNVTRTTSVAYSGQYAVKMFIDGKQDDGTIWLERRIAVSKNTRVKVTMTFWLYSEEESFNTIAAVVGYARTDNPEEESNFKVLGAANQVAGWKQYKFETAVDTGDAGELWVALGISVRWETVMTYYVDSVEITVR